MLRLYASEPGWKPGRRVSVYGDLCNTRLRRQDSNLKRGGSKPPVLPIELQRSRGRAGVAPALSKFTASRSTLSYRPKPIGGTRTRYFPFLSGRFYPLASMDRTINRAWTLFQVAVQTVGRGSNPLGVLLSAPFPVPSRCPATKTYSLRLRPLRTAIHDDTFRPGTPDPCSDEGRNRTCDPFRYWSPPVKLSRSR